MMAFIDNDVTITGDRIRNLGFGKETLYQRYIDAAAGLATTATDGADTCRVYREKLLQPFDPLLEQFLSMYQDQAVSSSMGNQRGGDDRFSKRRCRRQHTAVVIRQSVYRAFLLWPKRAEKAAVQLRTAFAQIVDVNFNLVGAQEFKRFLEASTG